MVQFAKKLAAAQRPEWRGHYLEYKQLKKKLKTVTASSFSSRHGDGEREGGTSTPPPPLYAASSSTALALTLSPTHSSSSSLGSPSLPSSSSAEASSLQVQALFQHALDSEVERVVLFFLTQQGELAQTLATLRREQQQQQQQQQQLLVQVPFQQQQPPQRHLPAQHYHAQREALRRLADQYRRVGDELVHLLHYVELNATGLRKILKKHDKVMKSRKIMGAYLSSRTDSQASHLQQLYHDEGISAIIATIRAALLELRTSEHQLALASPPRLTGDGSASLADGGADGGVTMTMTRALSMPRLVRSISEDEPVLSKITVARRRLQQSTQYVTTVAAQALIFDGESSEDEDDTEESHEPGYISFRARHHVSEISRLLNMTCTFLYMTNYYIVAPTSGDYAAALGGEAALSGVIVGMTPIASLVSAVLYSWWANRSYKSPLVFATLCLVVGNLLYGLALYYDSIAMAIAGRLLNGFGGARAINRRYIADNYSRDERTQASALFVTASALGMAAGPALAAALDYVPDFMLPGGIAVTTETAPGWVMFWIWLAYLVAIVWQFEEPTRAVDRRGSFPGAFKAVSESTSLEAGEQVPSVVTKMASEDTPLLVMPATTMTTTASASAVSLAPASGSAMGKARQSMTPAPSLISLWYNVPVVASLVIYIVLKLVLECLLTSSSLIAQYYFHWDSIQSGLYLAALGLLMFPTNVLVSWLCLQYEDRELMVRSQILMLLGVALIIRYGHVSSYSSMQFMIGGVVIFTSTNVLEGVNMALLSKTIPRAFAKGTFNSGLLATEAGTFGRALGDVLVTLVALPGLQHVLNWTFLPLLATCAATLVYTIRVYPHLVTHD